MSRIDRSTDVRAALRSRQRGFLLNPFRFGAGGGGGGDWIADWGGAVSYAPTTLNPGDKSASLTLSGGDLTAVRASGSGWAAGRSKVGKSRGKWYFEITNNANGSTTGDAMWGFARNADSLSTYPGNASLGATSMGWQANNPTNSAKFQNGSLGAVSGYGTVAVGQYSQFAIDLGAGKLWVKNSGAAGWAGGGDPAGGTTPTFTFAANTHLHPTIAAYSGPQSATANFGASAFAGSVPTGFNAGWYAPVSVGALSYVSSLTMPSSTDAQGVACDGTHLWFSSSTTIYKYTKAGALVTSRNVSGDAPTKTQINGMFIRGGVLYVSAAENSTPRKSYIVQYDPHTLAYIAHNQITGDWFSEGLAWKDGYWWVCFHANKVVAKVDPSTWSVSATYNLSFNVSGSSGGYGAGTGYDGIAWLGNYLLVNVHEIYDQNFMDVYYWDGTAFDEVERKAWPTSKASQGLVADPGDAGVLWFAERNYSGADSIAKVAIA